MNFNPKVKCIESQMVDYFVLFLMLLYIPVNNFSVLSGCLPALLGVTNAKHRLKCLAQ